MRICAIGDSIMNGTGDPEALGWIGRAVQPAKRRDPQVTLYNLGVRRDTSADIARRWRAEVEARRMAGVETALVFSFGVNDCTTDEATAAPRVAPEASAETGRALLAEASAIGRVLMVGPTPIDDDAVNARIADLDRVLERVAASAGVPYLRVYPRLAGSVWMTEIAAGDGAHPGAAGYALMAGLVADWPAWQRWFAPSC